MKAGENKFLADKLAQYQSGQLNEEEKAIIEQWFEDKLNQPQPDFLTDELKSALLKAALSSNLEIAIQKDNTHPDIENDTISRNKIAHIAHRKTNGTMGSWLKIAASVLLISALSFYGIATFKNARKPAPVSYQTFINLNGKVKKIALQDGTEIWMNAATQIRVATNFGNTKIRAVYLDKGEAFFQVKRDTLRPFCITTGHFITTVLGTSFNIKSYPELHTYQVAVATGKVKVESLTKGKRLLLNGGLVKDDVLNYNLVKNSYTLSKHNHALISSWKTEGSLYFDQLSLAEIAAALGRQYNIAVTVNNADQAKHRYTMKINHEPIQTILQQIALKTGMNYQLTTQKLIINPNPE